MNDISIPKEVRAPRVGDLLGDGSTVISVMKLPDGSTVATVHKERGANELLSFLKSDFMSLFPSFPAVAASKKYVPDDKRRRNIIRRR